MTRLTLVSPGGPDRGHRRLDRAPRCGARRLTLDGVAPTQGVLATNPATHGVRGFADRPDSRAIRPHAPWSLDGGLAVGSQHGMWSHRRRSRDLASDGDRPAAHLALDDPIMIHVGNIGTRAEVITVPRANPQDRVHQLPAHPRAVISRYWSGGYLGSAGADDAALQVPGGTQQQDRYQIEAYHGQIDPSPDDPSARRGHPVTLPPSVAPDAEETRHDIEVASVVYIGSRMFVACGEGGLAKTFDGAWDAYRDSVTMPWL
jgi:hypothetical protein